MGVFGPVNQKSTAEESRKRHTYQLGVKLLFLSLFFSLLPLYLDSKQTSKLLIDGHAGTRTAKQKR